MFCLQYTKPFTVPNLNAASDYTITERRLNNQSQRTIGVSRIPVSHYYGDKWYVVQLN